MRVKIQQRSDTAAKWSAANPVLAVGEIGHETDTGKIKVGDGVSSWNPMSYVGGEGSNTPTTATAPLGSIAWLVVNYTPDGYEPLWDGHNITRAQYTDFFNRMVDTNKIPTVTNAIFNSQVSSYGSCASFVKIDNNTLRLPQLTTYMRAAATTGGVLNDQIVNITGTLGSSTGESMFWSAQANQASGAMSVGGGYGKYSNSSANASNVERQMIFDASRVVRTGSEVQPKSFTARPFLKCADISRTLSEEETSEIRNLYASKADADLGNVNFQGVSLSGALIADAIVSKSLAYAGYYYKAPDGLLIQWGKVSIGSSVRRTVNFPIAFYSTPTHVSGSVISPGGGGAYTFNPFNVSTVDMSVEVRYGRQDVSGIGNEGFYWFAMGRWK